MNDTVVIDAEDRMSSLFAGYTLTDLELDGFVDQGIEFIVFLDPNRGRYTSTISDWQDYGVSDPTLPIVHLRQSRMDRG